MSEVIGRNRNRHLLGVLAGMGGLMMPASFPAELTPPPEPAGSRRQTGSGSPAQRLMARRAAQRRRA